MLVAAGLAFAGSMLHLGAALPALGASPSPAPLGTDRAALQSTGPNGPEATVAERPERATEASASDRRASARDPRVLELLAVLGIGLSGLTALAAAMARRRHGRAPTRSRRLAPARAPPLLLPS
jgi:hypothetical protein